MAADVEQEVLVVGRAADAADVVRIGLDDGGRDALLGQQIGGGQPGRAGTDDKHFTMGHEIRPYAEIGPDTTATGWLSAQRTTCSGDYEGSVNKD